MKPIVTNQVPQAHLDELGKILMRILTSQQVIMKNLDDLKDFYLCPKDLKSYIGETKKAMINFKGASIRFMPRHANALKRDLQKERIDELNLIMDKLDSIENLDLITKRLFEDLLITDKAEL